MRALTVVFSLLLAAPALARAVRPVTPLARYFTKAEVAPHKGDGGLRHWVAEQLRTHPEVKRTFDDISRRVSRATPENVGTLFELARARAKRHVRKSSLARLKGLEREHAVTLVAILALSGQSFALDGAKLDHFPVYMPDGRAREIGFDKTWHFLNHAMISYVRAVDRHYGDSHVNALFDHLVDGLERDGISAHVARAYDEGRGRSGPLVRNNLPGPREIKAPFFRIGKRLSAAEQHIYDQTVRAGDLYEVYSSGCHLDPHHLGPPSKLDDPVQSMNAYYEWVTGLFDPGVSRDLTANRLGAWSGLRLFRQPARMARLPFDHAARYASQPFGKDAPELEPRTYVGEELALLARLPNASPLGAIPAHADAAMLRRTLVDTMGAELTRLAATDPDKVHRYFANFAVRHLRNRALMPKKGGRYSRDFNDHYEWAKTASVEQIVHELATRADEVFADAIAP